MMLKKKALNRIFITTIALCIVMVIYTFTKIEKDTTVYDDYIYQTSDNKQVIYTLNENNILSKSQVYLNKKQTLEEQVKNLLEIMIEKNNKNSLLPSYLKPILPQNTKIISVKLVEDILKINFSKELYNISKEQSEKMIEAIVYTLSEFDGVLGIEISVEGNILQYVPNSRKKLPAILSTDIGINKQYEINNTNNITKVNLFYYGKSNNQIYDIPVTKYLNNNQEPLEIIVESLTTEIPKDDSIISYVNHNTKLLNYTIAENLITINLNNEIYDDPKSKEYNQKAIDALINSIFANYDVKKIRILVNNHQIIEQENK